jgi:elongator complex protein 3
MEQDEQYHEASPAYYSTIIEWIKQHKPTKQQVHIHKVHLCKQLQIKHVPTDIDIYIHASKNDQQEIGKYIQTKPTRSLSGVTVIATMSMPSLCPHGACTFCPGGLGSVYGDTPMSYTGTEPSTMRGIRNEFDPYRIIFNRLQQYIILGQFPDKIEQIIMGGTFPSFDTNYQEQYVTYSYKAYNDFSELFFKDGEFLLDEFLSFFALPGKVGDPKRATIIKERILAKKNEKKTTLLDEQIKNETAVIRCIGLTIETKPDWSRTAHALTFLRFGCTRVELGVQTVYDEVLQTTNRGHTIEETTSAIAELKDLGFKINYHIMPGLPDITGQRISKEKDLASIHTIFTDEKYLPDMAKIYPCMVMPGTPLEKEYVNGTFSPLNTQEAADIICEAFRVVQPWCRIMRIQRDIPTKSTKAGVDRTNLRQYVDTLLVQRGIISQDIRAREPRFQTQEQEPQVTIRTYESSNGTEYFVSMESQTTLYGFCRMRFVRRSLHPQITQDTAIIRELHVYGNAVRIGTTQQGAVQHRGYGRILMSACEQIARENSKKRMLVISGVGVREYYKKIGYIPYGPYMGKELS